MWRFPLIKQIIFLSLMIFSTFAWSTQRCTYQRGKVIEVPSNMKQYQYGVWINDNRKLHKFNFEKGYMEIQYLGRSLVLELNCVIIDKRNKKEKN